MKKYLTPNITVTTLLSQDVITSSFGITSVYGGDSISWGELKEKAGVGDGLDDNGFN